jgi:LytS/YehU family sensor histidine kinase
LFSCADKKEITLFDEIEFCKFYLELEAMRFNANFSYSVNVDDDIDLKSIFVPALIIQPFIENAIWHGIVPKHDGGNVLVIVAKNGDSIEIAIDDDGIGRAASRQYKTRTSIGHLSKGVILTQSRLALDNSLQQRQASLDILDKKDLYGSNQGTRVTIKLRPIINTKEQ